MDKKQKTVLFIVGALLAISIIVMAFVFFSTRKAGAFDPPEFAQSAKRGTPTVTDPAANYQSIVIGEGFSFSMCMSPLYEEGTAKIYFSSDTENSVYLLIKLYDSEENVIGESGLLKPGEYLEYLSVSLVPTVDTEIFARILSYEPDTYYSAGTVSGELIIRAPK